MNNHKISVFLAGILMASVLSVFAVKYHVKTRVGEEIRETAEFIPAVHNIDYQDLEVDLLGEGIRIEKLILTLTGNKDNIKIDEVVVHSMDRKSAVPDRMSVELTGIRLNTENPGLGVTGSILDMLGYSTVTCNISCDYRFNNDRKQLRIARLSMQAAELGSGDLSLHLANLNLDGIDTSFQNPVALMAALTGTLIVEGVFTYTDDTLVKKFLKTGAQMNRLSEEDYIEALRMLLIKRSEGKENPAGEEAFEKLSLFLKRPGTIRLVAKPARPVALGWFFWVKKPEDIVQLLNLKVDLKE